MPNGRHLAAPRPPRPARRPPAPLIDLDRIDQRIAEHIAEARKHVGTFNPPKAPAYESKFGGIVKDSFKRGSKGWLILHPVRLLGRVFGTKKGGLMAYRRAKKEYTAWGKLQAKLIWPKATPTIAPTMTAQQACNSALLQFEGQMGAFRAELENAVTTGRVTPNNVDFHLGNHNKKVNDAWRAFQGTINGIITEYREQMKKAKLIKEPGRPRYLP